MVFLFLGAKVDTPGMSRGWASPKGLRRRRTVLKSHRRGGGPHPRAIGWGDRKGGKLRGAWVGWGVGRGGVDGGVCMRVRAREREERVIESGV